MGKSPVNTVYFARKFKLFSAFICSLFLTSCGGSRSVLNAYTRSLKIGLNTGEVTYFEDNHGGFLGDGFMLCVVKYSSNEIEDEIKKSPKFSKYPLSKNLSNFIYGDDYDFPFDSDLKIPRFDNGYFYFYNRHSDAMHKETDEDLFETVSFNFSFVLYDCDNDLAYICDYDT